MAAALFDKGPTMDWSANEGLYNRFKMWKQRCELLFAGPMDKIEENVKCKYLLYWAGERGLELFNSWALTETEQKVLHNYWEKFEAFVKPQSNELMAAWELHHIKQENLSLEGFITKLRTLVKEANYPEAQQDRFLRDFLVMGMSSDKARKECLKTGNALTFEKARDLARVEESAEKQLQQMSKPLDVHSVKMKPSKSQGKTKSSHTQSRNDGKSKIPKANMKTCRNCGRDNHSKEDCPAKGVQCHYCSKIGHYARVCLLKDKQKRHVHEIGTASNSETCFSQIYQDAQEPVFLGPVQATPMHSNVNTVACKEKALLEIKLSDSNQQHQLSVLCKVDSGAETNILPISLYKKLHSKQHELNKPTVKLSAYGGTEIPNLGSCSIYAQSHINSGTTPIHVEVADVNGPAIIGNQTAQSLGLLQLNWPVITTPIPKSVGFHESKHPVPLTKEYLLQEYKDVFTGIGCFPGPAYHIVVDSSIPPVQHPPRQVPVHLQSSYLSELKKLEEAGIIREVRDEYTPWVNSTVISTKPNGSIRICLDPRDLNKAIKRNPYYVRTVDDVIPKVNGATHFSILDARNGYWQVPIDEESSKLCTFNTPWGKYRWTRLPFGLTVSGDIFQEKMDSIFRNLYGVSGIADDTFIHGKDELSHDQNIINVLETARRNNVKFNPDKFQFKVTEASFFGITWTPDGLKPDQRKIKAIVDMSAPKNLTEIQSFMGMINYLNRFSPTLAQTSLPIRQLMKSNTTFVWQAEQERAFQQLKQVISQAPVLSFYDPEKDNLIQSDASMKGLGCVLMQDGKPVYYASRSLTDAESRYSNIERELLAACWSLEKFNHYVYGKKVTIETDHKPLESIWKKSISSSTPRLQRLLLKMAKYEVDIKYIQGKTNVVADALSRVSHMELPSIYSDTPTIELNEITQTLPASPAKLDEIREVTDQDVVLHHLKEMIQQGWPEYIGECPPDLKEYWTFREDLSVENGLVLKGPRLVIPNKLRPQMLEIIHQGHMGTEKCLLRAKECIFWPNISKDIKELVTNCATCLQFSKQQLREPLHPHSIPSYPWQKLGSDLFDFKQSTYLLVADYYSKFPILRKLNSTTSLSIINHLKSIFAEYGIPETLMSDNGPQYSSNEFRLFCKQWGINHVTSSPTYPKSNGFIERMVQTVKSVLKKSDDAGEDQYLGILAYRATPVDKQLTSPAKLLNGREYRTLLPTSGRSQRTQCSDSDLEWLQHRQDMQKEQHDKKASSGASELHPRQHVVMYQPKQKVWTPALVQSKAVQPRSYIVKTDNGTEFRRNRIHLKPAHPTEGSTKMTSPSSESSSVTTPTLQTPPPPSISSPVHIQKGQQSPESSTMTTRSGRVITPPVKLDL